MTSLDETEAERRQRLAATAIKQLGERYSLRALERDVLKLAQGYLSRIGKKQGTPSAPLVALLVILSREPKKIETVRRLWLRPRKERRR